MDSQQRELVKMTAPVATPVVQMMVNYFLDSRMMDRQVENQVRLARERERAKASSEGISAAVRESNPASTESVRSGGVSSEIDEMIETETCGTCVHILKNIRSMSADRQEKGLAEYRQLKDHMEAKSDEETVRSFIESTDVISEIL